MVANETSGRRHNIVELAMQIDGLFLAGKPDDLADRAA